MEFYKHLKENKIYDFLEHTEYVSPVIVKYDKFKEFVTDILITNRKVLLYGDYDPDGLMCILEWKAFFNKFSYYNYDIFKYRSRTHKVDEFAIRSAIEGKYDYIIINDAGSGDMSNIKKLIAFGVKVIIVDHHQTMYSYKNYPEECVIVNSVLENKYNKERRFKQPELIVSAGALVFILLEKILTDYRKPGKELSAYALCSFYADCVDMSSEINRGIYHMATNLYSDDLPVEIRAFLNKYTSFTRRFIEFHMTPKINSAFRSERFEDLNNVFLTKDFITENKVLEVVESLSQLHAKSATMADTATDIIYFEHVGDFVVGNLNTVNEHINISENRLYNFTGLIANKLADRFKKPAVVYCGNSGNVKGSFRDTLGRNYLNTFKVFSESEGHNAAFGIKLNVFEVPDFLRHLKEFGNNEEAKLVTNEPIKVQGYVLPPNLMELNDIAKYNEFAGITQPLTVLEVIRTYGIKERPDGYGGYLYKWDSYNIKSRRRIPVGSKILIKPTVGKGLKLYAV